MGHALGNTLPLAVAIAVFPIPIIAAVLLVASPRGDAKGLAFALAWAAGGGGGAVRRPATSRRLLRGCRSCPS